MAHVGAAGDAGAGGKFPVRPQRQRYLACLHLNPLLPFLTESWGERAGGRRSRLSPKTTLDQIGLVQKDDLRVKFSQEPG